MIKRGGNGEILSKEMKEMQAAMTRPSECKTTKMSPADCLRNGVSIDKAREISLAELTREDAEYLLNNGISKHGLAKLYNSKDGSMYPKLTKWGLHHPGAAMSAKQRMDAFEIECPSCHANYKRVEMIDTHDRGMMCLKCYDEKPVIEIKADVTIPEDMTAEEIREAIDEAAAKIIGVDIPDSPCAPWETEPEEFISADTYALTRKNPVIADSGQRTEFNTGAVRDMHEGKGRMDLLPWRAIIAVAKLCEHGAIKYGEHNVDHGIPTHSLADSAMRHGAKYLSGDNDENHAVSAAWNWLWLIEMELAKPEMQDIPARLAVHKS